jgi:predicted 2-oxoglutarate/Fe(II)-dependent dioxygenase YbiX
LQTKGVWINKVKPTTNLNDAFHFDTSDLTIVTYLNDEFEGGEFEYIDNNENTIHVSPKKGMSLIMNNKLLHKVLPITKGERLSLVCFFDLKIKESKSLL